MFTKLTTALSGLVLTSGLALLGCNDKPAAAPATADPGAAKQSAKPAPTPAKPDPAAKPGPAIKPAPANPTATAPPDGPGSKAGHEHKGPLTWLHDDYEAARKQALASKTPIVIDLWAPWCHTCLSMQQTVLADQAMAPFAKRFTWLTVDTDKAVNAGVLEKFPVGAWPTFYVISPVDESIQARFVGGATSAQIAAFLKQGEKGHLAVLADKDELADAPWLNALRKGDADVADGLYPTAITAYREALAKAPKDWDRRSEVLVELIRTLYRQADYEGCIELASARLTEAAASRGASTADFAQYGDLCAGQLRKVATSAQMKRIEALRRAIVAEDGPVRKVLDDPASPLSVDDRSDGLRIVRMVHVGLKDRKAGRVLALRQKALLDDAVAKAPNAIARMTYAWPRCEVYDWLGIGDRLVPELQALTKALPKEYDPPYRLGWMLYHLGRNEESLTALNQAEPLAYGPRKARVMLLKADVLGVLKRGAEARTTRQAVVKLLEGLPEAQQQPALLAQVKAKL